MNNLPKGVWLAVAGLVIAFLALAVVEKAQNLSQNFNARPQNTISMSADGKVTAKPDLATVTVGVLTNSSTAKAASDDNNTSINKVTDAIKKLGIADADIVTSNLSVYPNYVYDGGKNKIDGYQANQTLTIKVHGVDKSTDVLNKVLDAAVTQGSNQIQGVSFSFDDPDNLKQQARTQALEKAKQKATELANEAGLKLGRIVSISEGSVSEPGPIPYAYDAAKGMGGGGSAPAVQTGSQDVTATMTVIFEVK